MSQKNEIENLIRDNRRILSILEKQKALFGIYTPPYIIMQLEDIKDEIARLKEQYDHLYPNEFTENCQSTSNLVTTQSTLLDNQAQLSLDIGQQNKTLVELSHELESLKETLPQAAITSESSEYYLKISRLIAVLNSVLILWGQDVAIKGDLTDISMPHFQADTWFLPSERLLGFVEIGAGKFSMGSHEEDDGHALSEEKPQHILNLPSYYISKYLVTVVQFRTFLKDSGYKIKNQQGLDNPDDHPITSVNWLDAMRYCRWLNQKLQNWEGLPQRLPPLFDENTEQGNGWVITLPSEAEWEKAARGTDGRRFPWGSDKSIHNYANCDHLKDSTTAVGTFIKGISPFGLRDMSGNVTEWTRSLWGPLVEEPYYQYPYKPDERELPQKKPDWLIVTRGGGFNHPLKKIRCAHRSASYPNDGYENLGFRLAISKISASWL